MVETKQSQAGQFKIAKTVKDEKSSKLDLYQNLILGKNGFGNLIKYELITTLISGIPGAFGLFLRSKLFPKMVLEI